MRTILCYGDSNTWGAIPRQHLNDIRRYSRESRWTGVLSKELGQDFFVIDEGLRGRTTVYDDPIEGLHKNGSSYLIPCLESHEPLDMVVLLLGTNDLKNRFSASAREIALGAGVLIDMILKSGNSNGSGNPLPAILLLAPPPVGRLTFFSDVFEGAEKKSRELGEQFQRIAEAYNCLFLDTAEIIQSSDIDGIHLEEEEHCKLGQEVARIIHSFFEPS